MATKSIGSASRDYSTPQAWEDALAATLTEQEIGELYNDSEFVFSTGSAYALAVSPTTTASFDIIFRAAAGESFRDHASVRTNALRYNASNGASMRSTAGWGCQINNSGTGSLHVTIEGIQFKCEDEQSWTAIQCGASSNVWVVQNILEEVDRKAVSMTGTGWLLRNCVFIATNPTAVSDPCVDLYEGGRAEQCTVVNVSGSTAYGQGIRNEFGTTASAQNCAVFGFNTAFNGTFGGSPNGNNATDAASAPGSSNQVSKTFSSQFENISLGTHDFRAKAGADLLANGTADNATDIVGYTRASPPTIGAWEYALITIEQEGFRVYNDDGDEDASTAYAAQDTDFSRSKDTNVRLRFLLNMGSAPGAKKYRLKYRKQGGAGWRPVAQRI